MKRPHWQTQGREPDYRFSLANERTFLAWIRTALALLAGGVLLDQLTIRNGPNPMVLGLALMLAAVAACLCAFAYVRWQVNERAMRMEQPLPPSAMMPALSLALVLCASGLAVFMLHSG
ncbi:MAG: DUF202 domain-containing protein [Burkholderiaceae bacterium]